MCTITEYEEPVVEVRVELSLCSGLGNGAGAAQRIAELAYDNEGAY
jgi:hypothetical protein